MPTPKGYTRTQIVLHWVIFLLIGFQLIFGEDIAHAYDDIMEGTATPSFMVVSHVWLGVLVLLLVIPRFIIKARRGAPAQPEHEPAALKTAANVTHLSLYALMFVLPISGGLAWFAGQEWAGDIHTLLKPVTIILVVLHVAGALYQQFILKTDVLNRMRTPE